MSYSAVIQGWHDVYVIAGTASATLVGLLFVGLSLHLRTVVSRPEVRSLARVTLANYALVLMVSLFMVIPETATSAGIELLASGAGSALVVAPSLLAARQSRTRTIKRRYLLLRFGSGVVCYAGVAVIGILLLNGRIEDALSWLVAITLVLLIGSLRNSWDLLVSVGAATMDTR